MNFELETKGWCFCFWQRWNDRDWIHLWPGAIIKEILRVDIKVFQNIGHQATRLQAQSWQSNQGRPVTSLTVLRKFQTACSYLPALAGRGWEHADGSSSQDERDWGWERLEREPCTEKHLQRVPVVYWYMHERNPESRERPPGKMIVNSSWYLNEVQDSACLPAADWESSCSWGLGYNAQKITYMEY